MKNNNVSLLILSSGGYQDIWIPQFFYLKKYLESDLFDNIFLSTDYYNSMVPERIEILESNNAWSDRLIEALERIDSDNVFIILEDYILQTQSNLKLSYEIFKNHDLDYLRVSYKKKLPNRFLYRLSKFKKYNISLQPGYWRKDFLKRILRPKETPWDFEILGSLRNIFIQSKCFALGANYFLKNKMPFPCLFTGSVVKGKLIKTEYTRFYNEVDNLIFTRELIEDNSIIDSVRLNKIDFFLGTLKKYAKWIRF